MRALSYLAAEAKKETRTTDGPAKPAMKGQVLGTHLYFYEGKKNRKEQVDYKF